MAYKDILVYLDPTPASAARLELALKIAAVEGAYVTGVDASTDEAFTSDWREAATGIEVAFAAAERFCLRVFQRSCGRAPEQAATTTRPD